LSVAISSNGKYVAAGNNSGINPGSIYYFADADTKGPGLITQPTWISDLFFGGSIERGTLDMSDDGEYVVVGGTGIDVWYFAGCTQRSSFGETATWTDHLTYALDILTVDMSSNGKYVVAGGSNGTGGGVYPGFVIFYTDAYAMPTQPT